MTTIRILHVDDEPDIREVVELLLQAQGRWREILAHYGIAE